MEHQPRILFACSGNTCRSLMAEYLARRKFGRAIEITSAGLAPGVSSADEAIAALRDLNIDASQHSPRDIADLDVQSYDYVIAMDSSVAREFKRRFPSYPPRRVIKWSIDDPWGTDLAEYRACAEKIFKKLNYLPFFTQSKKQP